MAELNIEDLLNQEITSVSKTGQRFADTAAAVFVITAEDLRRSGVTTIPDALRMVPGFHVARVDSGSWAVSSRGFNSRFANKLLVLIDGRTVYTPSFSGVYWETEDLLLEDIERIEVIRGPGASVWGANAVNGIVNVITRSAEDTVGGLVSLAAGDEVQHIVGARYGGRLGQAGHYRVYAKSRAYDGLLDVDGQDAGDGWDDARIGFRVDLAPTANDTVSVFGDIYEADIDQNFIVPSATSPTAQERVLEAGEASGGSLLGRWERVQSLASRLTGQFFYRRFQRDDTFQDEQRDTFDLELKQELALSQGQDLVWGLGYRLERDHIRLSPLVSVDPERRDLHLASAFFQYVAPALADRLEFTLGSKLEHHSEVGFQLLPTARLLWKPDPRQRLWGAISRASRTPSRGERDAELEFVGLPLDPVGNGLPTLVTLEGSDDFDSETVWTAELGYRIWPRDDLFLDLAAFYSDYDDLRFAVVEPTGIRVEDGFNVIPTQIINGENGRSWGLELAADWRPNRYAHFQLAYSYLQQRFELEDEVAGDPLLLPPLGDDRDPRHQLSLRAGFNLRHDLELDLWARYVDGIDDLQSTQSFVAALEQEGDMPAVDDYATLDVRLGWRPRKDLELSLVGRNLVDSERVEFLREVGTFPTRTERSVYGQIRWQF